MAENKELYLMRLGEVNTHHKVTNGEFHIGRDQSAFITCMSPFVSRKHLILIKKRQSSHLLIKDLKTANGSFLNGKRILPEKLYPFKEDDVISLGVQEDQGAQNTYMFKLISKPCVDLDNANNNGTFVISEGEDDVFQELPNHNTTRESLQRSESLKNISQETHEKMEISVCSQSSKRSKSPRNSHKNDSSLDVARHNEQLMIIEMLNKMHSSPKKEEDHESSRHSTHEGIKSTKEESRDSEGDSSKFSRPSTHERRNSTKEESREKERVSPKSSRPSTHERRKSTKEESRERERVSPKSSRPSTHERRKSTKEESRENEIVSPKSSRPSTHERKKSTKEESRDRKKVPPKSSQPSTHERKKSTKEESRENEIVSPKSSQPSTHERKKSTKEESQENEIVSPKSSRPSTHERRKSTEEESRENEIVFPKSSRPSTHERKKSTKEESRERKRVSPKSSQPSTHERKKSTKEESRENEIVSPKSPRPSTHERKKSTKEESRDRKRVPSKSARPSTDERKKSTKEESRERERGSPKSSQPSTHERRKSTKEESRERERVSPKSSRPSTHERKKSTKEESRDRKRVPPKSARPSTDVRKKSTKEESRERERGSPKSSQPSTHERRKSTKEESQERERVSPKSSHPLIEPEIRKSKMDEPMDKNEECYNTSHRPSDVERRKSIKQVEQYKNEVSSSVPETSTCKMNTRSSNKQPNSTLINVADCATLNKRSRDPRQAFPRLSKIERARSTCQETSNEEHFSGVSSRTRSSSAKRPSSTPIEEMVSGDVSQCKKRTLSRDSRMSNSENDIWKVGRVGRTNSYNGMVKRRSILDDVYEPDKRPSVSSVNTCIERSRITTLEVNKVFPTWLTKLSSIILHWNVNWMKEKKTNKNLPPIFNGKAEIPPMGLLFQQYSMYIQALTNMMVLEVWDQIFNTYITTPSNDNDILTLEITGCPIEVQNHSKLWQYLCRCPLSPKVDHLLQKKSVGLGTLCIITKDCDSSVRSFGMFNSWEIKVTKSVKYLYVTLFSKLKSTVLSDGAKIILNFFVNLRNEMMQAKALYVMGKSKLAPIITCPKQEHFHNFNSNVALQLRHKLNQSQTNAVQQCITAVVSEIPNIQFVQGPPGTGKSRVIVSIVMEYIWRQRKSSNKKQVFVAATTNAAADEIVKRLLEKRDPNLYKIVRIGRFENMMPWSQNVSSVTLAKKANVPPELHPQIDILIAKMEQCKTKMCGTGPQAAYNRIQYDTHKKKLEGLRQSTGGLSTQKEEIEVIKNADIIVSTLQGFSSSKLQPLSNNAFCIIDEAAKATESEVLIPLSLGVKCLILVGDVEQLSGFTRSQHAKDKGYADGMFKRLLDSTSTLKNISNISLGTQYRMDPAIASFPNEAFYEGKLKNGIKYPPLPRLIPPYRVVNVLGGPCAQGESGANFNEAVAVVKMAVAYKSLITREMLNVSLCILTPYAAHKEALQVQLRTFQCNDLEVHTVDSFQGQERDIVLISLARTSGSGFLYDTGRMCVLLTRAKRACIIFCNSSFMQGAPLWQAFLSDAQTRKMYRELPRKVITEPYLGNQEYLNSLLQFII